MLSRRKRKKPVVWSLASVPELLFSLPGFAGSSSCSLRPQGGARGDKAREDWRCAGGGPKGCGAMPQPSSISNAVLRPALNHGDKNTIAHHTEAEKTGAGRASPETAACPGTLVLHSQATHGSTSALFCVSMQRMSALHVNFLGRQISYGRRKEKDDKPVEINVPAQG